MGKKRSFFKTRFPLDAGENPSRALTWAYITAFGLIATLTIASHLVTAYITGKQKESTEISYHIGKQRTLVQRIPLHASNYNKLGEQLDRDFLMQAIRNLEDSHKQMSERAKDQGKKLFSGKTLFRIYYTAPFFIDAQMGKFLDVARQYVEASADNEHQGKIREKALEYLDKQSSGLLVPLLDAGLENYQAKTASDVVRYYRLQMEGTFIILIVLLIEAAFIFRPLARRIDKYYNMLLRQALEDPLTELPNRRAFMNNAGSELQQAIRQDASIVVALADLDHFKLVNDTYGHEVGDKVLQHFSGILKSFLRTGDIVGRIGGEEFAMVLVRSTDRGGGEKVLKRLCEKVANTPCEYETSDGKIDSLDYTVSMGFVATAPDQDTTIDDLLRQADEALYKAKEQGRNRAVAA